MKTHEAKIITLMDMTANYLDLFEELWNEWVEFTPEQIANYIKAAEYLKASGKQRDWSKLDGIKTTLENDFQL